MSDQMPLLPDIVSRKSASPARAQWEIDDRTRELGRRGLAAARQALLEASARLAA